MTKRNSNLEFLRIIAMFLIIIHHLGLHGLTINTGVFTYNYIYKSFLQLPGKLGIDIFIILSSYFMIDSRFNFKKIIKLIGETLFYSISILLVFSLFTSVHINIFDIIKSLFPILFTEYWFITDYILLMIITPFLNDFIKSLEKNNYKKLLITLIILNVIINGTFHFFIKHISNILIWFIILYLIVGYIKKYNVIKDNNYKRNIIYFIIIIFIYLLCVSLFTVVGHILKKDILIVNAGYFGTENSIFTVLAAFEIFVAFLKMKPRTNKFINIIASSTLGIYLIHDNNIMRQFLWNNIFRVQKYIFSPYLILYSIVVSLIIFLFGFIIDLIRQFTIEKIWLIIGNRLYNFAKKIGLDIYYYSKKLFSKINLL